MRVAQLWPHACSCVLQAAQCCELDVLVPLRYLSSKLIMIGDPKQLPATVKSRRAVSFGYSRSLFERLYDHFGKLSSSGMHVFVCHGIVAQFDTHFPNCAYSSMVLEVHGGG